MQALRTRPITSLQTVYNMLEQEPGAEFLELGEAAGVGIIARVPTSSGLLEGQLTPDHTFEGNDHRRHRPRSWLIDGLKKVDKLDFLTRDGERTLAQVGYRFILSKPAIATVVHTVNTCAQLDEWGRATDVPPLDDDELAAFDELYSSGFGMLEPSGKSAAA